MYFYIILLYFYIYYLYLYICSIYIYCLTDTLVGHFCGTLWTLFGTHVTNVRQLLSRHSCGTLLPTSCLSLSHPVTLKLSLTPTTFKENPDADPEIGGNEPDDDEGGHADAAAADDDQDQEDDPDPDAETEPAEPLTRQQLYAFYSGKGPASMVYDFLCDPLLQGQCIVLSSVVKPLETLYQETLKIGTRGPDALMRFHADRAWSSHFTVAVECAKMHCDDVLLHRLGFPGSMSDALPAPVLPPGKKDTHEYKLHKLIFDFGFTMAAETIWSHLHFQWCFPHCIAAILLPKDNLRKKAVRHMKELALAIAAAEKVENPKAELKQCLDHLSFHREYLPRVIMQKGLRDGFDSDEMRDFAIANWSTISSTKELLESAFNNCNRQIGFMTVAKVASHPLKWIVTTLNPFLRQIGMSQFLPTETDWWAALKSPQGQQAVQSWADRWFDINSEALPDLPKRTSVEPVPDEEPQGPLTGNAILSKMNFKPAGADAMRRSAAAAAYLQSDYKTGFENVGTCWTGA